ncbi:hypothetical protein KUCAC02_029085 [Chaenocephalus aceratus]|uniref:Uncharacterized protein n=1 Tax=Chaenocephalus aceratus TaxID=36190 RepID=A0ACB9X4I6_CHAAC|nr:hypothetical protein KUCAC02_029085 [Chaenocephalus aceratus]
MVEQVNKRIEVTEGRVSELEAEVSNHLDSITCMTSDVDMKKELQATLRDRCEDLEARSRRCNIRIIGVKEGREHGKHPSQCVADMLKVSLGIDKPPTLNRAHRALRSRATQDGLPPWDFIVKFHYLSEKESLLKKAIEMKSVTTPDGDQIRLLPDFTQAVSKQRAAFTEGSRGKFQRSKTAKEFVLNKVVHKAS